MPTFERALPIEKLVHKSSCFLFGPRSTGKTFLIRERLSKDPRVKILDLLRARVFTDLAADPSALESLANKASLVVIDEVQKLPMLLDEVHRLIEEKGLRFLMTGSSARKLKREQANMLGGRATKLELFPLIYREIPNFDLTRALRWGTLPAVWLSEDPLETLDAYVSTYLKEEILEEGLTRHLPAFNRFLRVAALSSGQLINFAQLASDARVAETTTRGHFEVLQDTLIGSILEPFVETRKRKAIATAKFFLFDNGVCNFLAGIESMDRHSDLYGRAFEAFLAHEIRAYLSYRRIKRPLTYWRSTSQFEVDFLIGDRTAIEVKATTRASERDLRGLRALSEEGICKNYLLVTQDPLVRRIPLAPGAKADLMDWKTFLGALWEGNW